MTAFELVYEKVWEVDGERDLDCLSCVLACIDAHLDISCACIQLALHISFACIQTYLCMHSATYRISLV